jgi:Tol biopolymer transport system component
MPGGSVATDACWSTDSLWLAVVTGSTTGTEPLAPEIWGVDSRHPDQEARQLYVLPSDKYPGPAQIQLGPWSPDAQRLVFWSGPLSASILADGLPMFILDTLSGKAEQISQASLLNPFYQSWAPDGTRLAFTDGGYRSAQIDKNLAIYDVTTGMLEVPITAQEQVPGALAWSPDGRWIAYAAVPAEETGPDWADWMAWDNPAIAGRRIFLFDPATGGIQRLNNTDAFQDAPAWGNTGSQLFYVQAHGSDLILMKSDMVTRASSPVPGCRMERPQAAGYYGQPEWRSLLDCR